jgi:hypothetical protein
LAKFPAANVIGRIGGPNVTPTTRPQDTPLPLARLAKADQNNLAGFWKD